MEKLAGFSIFAANHQPSTSRLPQKSWPADGSENESKNIRGGTITGNNCSASLGRISMSITTLKELLFVNFANIPLEMIGILIALRRATVRFSLTDPCYLDANLPRHGQSNGKTLIWVSFTF